MKWRQWVGLSLLSGALIGCAHTNAPSALRDAVREDPSPSLQPPASMEELAIESHGARINGFLLRAAGPSPHPIVIFLHGYPGNERNIDLAQAVRRAGYHALYIDYRGDFGSGGVFSKTHSLEDAHTAIAWVRSEQNSAKYGIDPTRIAIVGHSFGGWLALMAGAREPSAVCIAAFAASNSGWVAQRFADHPEERTEVLDYYRFTTDPAGGPIRANPDDLLAELSAHVADWDFLQQASVLARHSLLLAAATRDTPDEGVEMSKALAEAVRQAGGRSVALSLYEDDHPFSSHRVALAQTLVHWLQSDCSKSQGHDRN